MYAVNSMFPIRLFLGYFVVHGNDKKRGIIKIFIASIALPTVDREGKVFGIGIRLEEYLCRTGASGKDGRNDQGRGEGEGERKAGTNSIGYRTDLS